MEKESRWHNAKTERPPMDEEVIVMNKIGRISFGHIVDPMFALDYDGWNIPDVAFWMPCNFTDEMLEFYEQ